MRNRRWAGLHLPELEPPLRLASVAGASHGNTMTSYPQEGSAVFLMEDKMHKVKFDKQDRATSSDEYLFGGPCHKMVMQSGRS
eukprot:4323607-Pyramimonas_sp.AAC.1